MSEIEYLCDAILFDLDGVLVDSIGCTERAWRSWAEARGVDVVRTLQVSHGRPVKDTLRLLVPQLDTATEVAYLEAIEAHETEGVRAVAGAHALLARLPPASWAIVTSATRSVAELRLRHTGLHAPDVLVTADDISRGKPDPEGYLTAAARLGIEPSACLVIEDAVAGIDAARAAGMRVIAITSTRRADELRRADGVVSALTDLEVVGIAVPLRVRDAGTAHMR